MRFSLAALALAALAQASPVPEVEEHSKRIFKKPEPVPFGFTSTFNIIATPDQVVGADNVPTGGLANSKGIFKFGLNSHEDIICYNITLLGFRGNYQSLAKTSTHIHEAVRGKAGPPSDEENELNEEEEEDDDDDAGNEAQESTKKKAVPRAAQERLAQDDAEIEAFERKLGIKKGRKSLPQSFKEDGLDELMGELGGFDSDMDKTPAQPRQRENPYVAPTTGVTVAKYVPPSLRKAAGTEEEHRSRLRKQIQGLINRLTDGNILSIVQSVEELYQNNARGDVTDIITDSIMAQICKPESLPDQFFVLTGGFAAAIYRIIGSSFGSHLIRRVVTDFGEQYDQASKEADEQSAIAKEASNILTFISQLYVFEVASCKIVFDYMERLLSDLTEINVELLLRICRMAGRLLRRDDPHAIKHVARVLNQSVSKAGYANISIRTKFMIETITDLKNSKPKGRGLDSAVVSEHVQRMKKRLGELKSQSRRLDGLAPMGVGLADIEGADTKGKWWLVGASVPVKSEKSKGERDAEKTKDDAYESSDNEDMDMVLPDYPKKARAQGLSGTPQIAIFTALMSATNFEHGYRQFVNLRLKKDDQLEIARVLVQCVGNGTLNIAILKPLELPEANTWTSMFVQRLIIALLHECRSKGASEDAKVEKMFGPARELPGLAAGIHWMLRKRIRKTKLIGAKELKKLEGVREKAQAAVQVMGTED
ncbi:hypothetical protein AUP68_16114 [Ilyonectria robusta]